MKRKMREQNLLKKEPSKGADQHSTQDEESASQSSVENTEDLDAKKNVLETNIQAFFAEEESLEVESDTETLESNNEIIVIIQKKHAILKVLNMNGVVALKRKIQERRILEQDFVRSADTLLDENDDSATQSSVVITDVTETLNDVINHLENKNDESTSSEEKPLLEDSDNESTESNSDSVMSENNSDPDSTKDGQLEMQ